MSDESESRGPVVLRTFGSRVEAEIVAGVLRDSGIDAVVRADDLGGTDPALWMVRGVHVLVRPADRDRAEEIAASIEPVPESESGADDDDSVPGTERPDDAGKPAG